MLKFYTFRKRSLKYLGLALVFALSAAVAQGQSVTITGKVTDSETQQGLPGASVLVVGTTTGTVTDVNGDFSITVDQAGPIKLAISFVGYASTTIDVNTSNGSTAPLSISLKPDFQSLDEVVVTGSTLKQAKRELGNNISTVGEDALQRSGSSNLFSALQGKVPGAQITQNSGDPAGGMTIRMRGVKSLSGNSDPLYVIDGVVVSNSTVNVSQTALNGQVGGESLGNNRLVDINPADIETLTVINGAAAAAQYGTRAANGVVLITTKKGKSGAPQFTFSTSFNVNELRKKVPITTYGKQFGSVGLRLNTIGVLATNTPGPGETLTPITRDGVLGYLRSNTVDVTRYDYQNQIFRTGYGTDNNLSISGGNERTQYFTSVSYVKNEGIIKGTDFRRYNLRARIDQRLAQWAKLSVGLSYANSFANEKANGNVFYSPINSINITNNIYDITKRDAAGKLLPVEPTRLNPLSTIEDMNFTQQVSRTVNDLQLNLSPIKGLGIDFILGVDSYTQVGRSLINPYAYASAAGLPANLYPLGYAANATNNVTLVNNDINISYERQLTDDLKLTAIIGNSYQYFRSEYQQANGQTLAPFITTINGAASTTVLASYFLDQYSLQGTFVQATFGYKNLAFITGAVRRDQSSKFGPSQSTQTFPKLSASLVLSDLEFWKNSMPSDLINSVKLRTSWGQAGNFTGIGSYDRFWQFSPVAYLGKNTIVPGSQLANSNLKPERMTELEFGADFGFWKNKINLGLTFYNQSIEDLIVNRGLASSEGGTSIINNVGKMENTGTEISLNVVPVETSEWKWDFTFIFNRNRNKVTQLGSPTIAVATNSGAPTFLIEGAPASVFYGTAIARDANGNPLLTSLGLLQSERGTQSSATPLQYVAQRDGAGQPSGAAIRKIIGNPNPDWTGSFVSNVSYKNFNFNFLIDFVQGVSVFNADKRTRQGVGIGDWAEKEYKGEITRGYIYAMYNTLEWRVDDGSFIKLREIGLSYDLKSPIKGISNVNIGFTGRNLISWDNYNGFDPETNSGGNSDIIRGVDFGNVPIPRTYKLQLTLKF
jgi:TonB-linked SusC/RagA family outer membrane protein